VSGSRIYKFAITAGLTIPHFIQPLHVGLDGTGTLCLWGAIGDEYFDRDMNAVPASEQNEVCVHATGVDIEYTDDFPNKYVGTVVEPNGLVWHVSYRPTPEHASAIRQRQAEQEEHMKDMLAQLREGPGLGGEGKDPLAALLNPTPAEA
jgi:hypothetical protein